MSGKVISHRTDGIEDWTVEVLGWPDGTVAEVSWYDVERLRAYRVLCYWMDGEWWMGFLGKDPGGVRPHPPEQYPVTVRVLGKVEL